MIDSNTNFFLYGPFFCMFLIFLNRNCSFNLQCWLKSLNFTVLLSFILRNLRTFVFMFYDSQTKTKTLIAPENYIYKSRKIFFLLKELCLIGEKTPRWKLNDCTPAERVSVWLALSEWWTANFKEELCTKNVNYMRSMVYMSQYCIWGELNRRRVKFA